MAKFNGWYFQWNSEDDLIQIVSASRWDSGEQTLDDSHIDSELEGILPNGFYEACESMFETEFSYKDGIKKLKAAGFKQMQLFDEE